MALAATLIAGFVTAAPNFAAAATPTATTTVTVALREASAVSTATPTRSLRGETLLRVAGSRVTSLLKFDTSALARSATVVGARLDLYVEQPSRSGAALVVRPAASNWSASTVTAARRPARDGRTLNAPAPVTARTWTTAALRGLTVAGTTAVEVGAAQADATVTFDKTGARAPRLVLTVVRQTALMSPAAATPGLAFALPPRSAHRKPVFALYFTPDPISQDNFDPAVDYYTSQYLDPQGEKGKWSFAGGLHRDRPVPQAPVPGNWRLANLETEVRQAISAGLDGFELDLMDFSGYNWEAAVNLMQAAQNVDPTFKIMIVPDMGGALRDVDPDTMAKGLSVLAAYSSAYRNAAGNLVLAPFAADNKTPQFWAAVLDRLRGTHAVPTVLLPILLDIQHTFDAFAPISWGLTEWGVRDTNAVATRYDFAAKAHRLGKVWMAPVAVQDERPRSGFFYEAGNTELLRATWNQATTRGADLAAVITWNDYSENTNVAPSANHGWSFLDINAYYMSAFQTGSFPAVTADALYITHRIQPYAATYRYTAEKPMLLRGTNPTPARDTVEFLTFLTAPAVVTATVGSRVVSYTAPAGVHAQLVPLGLGGIRGSIARNGVTLGTATAAVAVTGQPYVQDLSYYAVSSLRPNPRRR